MSGQAEGLDDGSYGKSHCANKTVGDLEKHASNFMYGLETLFNWKTRRNSFRPLNFLSTPDTGQLFTWQQNLFRKKGTNAAKNPSSKVDLSNNSIVQVMAVPAKQIT